MSEPLTPPVNDPLPDAESSPAVLGAPEVADSPPAPDDTSGGLLRVRATVGLRGLPRGAEAFVDPANPYIAGALERGVLVPSDPLR